MVDLQLCSPLSILFHLERQDILDLQGVLGQPAPVLDDLLLVLILVGDDALVGLQDLQVVGQVEDDVLHHLQVVIILPEGEGGGRGGGGGGRGRLSEEGGEEPT